MEAQDQKIEAFLSSVQHKLLVMSGKGGVGKSTVAANLAVCLSNKGFKVGLLDVDVHGPTVAGLLGLTGLTLNAVNDKIIPFTFNENLKIISMQGLLNNPDDALIWRGPLKISAIRQFLSEVDWGPLDYLIIDSPPGTGDEPLTIAQTIPDCQAVVVTTPQEVALADVRKSIRFCQQVNMKILGLIENMSGFVCPNCKTVHEIFKSGGGKKTAIEWHIPYLGKLPLDPSVVTAGDNSDPLRISDTTKDMMEEIINNILFNLSLKNKVESKGVTSNMKIAIPVVGENLCSHFGHCEQFVIFTIENGKVATKEKLTPPPHEPGVIPNWLAQQGATTVLVGGMGERAQDILKQKGVNVVCGITLKNPDEIVSAYLADNLKTTENACNHDHDDHTCGH